MPSTTTKGYPFPVGTDRVMDGDNAIQALAEAVDADLSIMKCITLGQSVAAGAVTSVSWAAATENGPALTKTSASVWTVTQAGIYVVSAQVSGATQASRAHLELWAGNYSARSVSTGENRGAAALVQRLIVGDTIRADVFWTTAASVTAGGGGYLNVARIGR